MTTCMWCRGECAGCLFLLSDGRPVSTDHFSNTLRKCLERAHLDSQAFTAHFRIGAATHAVSSAGAMVFRCLYWTDSPSSQYRNKTMSSVISEHEALFGIPACWNYFEAGHGKGPCDGIGGIAKRMADQAVTIQGTTIQDAHEFYIKDECEESRAYLAEKYGKVKAIAGTKLVGDTRKTVLAAPVSKKLPLTSWDVHNRCFDATRRKEYNFEPRRVRSAAETWEVGSGVSVAPPTHPELIEVQSVEWDGVDVETEGWR
ncbi:hypothetical protein Bbelb_036140 [Branchiostoma belcheri]|nr:hypothetical protein Bbelb_036140 [Branchiostoma belcheri]